MIARYAKACVLTLAAAALAGCSHGWNRGPQYDSHRAFGGGEAPPVGLPDELPKILPKTHLAAARLLERKGELQKAITQYRKAIAVNHRYAEAYHRLGILLSRVGRVGEAIAALSRAVEIDPDNVILRNNFGYTLMLAKQWDPARAELARASDLAPGFARARINLGMVLGKLGRFDEALEHFAAVLPAPDAHYNLGLIFRGCKRYEEAAEAFEHALSLNPNFAAASGQLEQIAAHRTPVPQEREDRERVVLAEMGPPTPRTSTLPATERLGPVERAPAPRMSPTERSTGAERRAEVRPDDERSRDEQEPASPEIVAESPTEDAPKETALVDNASFVNDTVFVNDATIVEETEEVSTIPEGADTAQEEIATIDSERLAEAEPYRDVPAEIDVEPCQDVDSARVATVEDRAATETMASSIIEDREPSIEDGEDREPPVEGGSSTDVPIASWQDDDAIASGDWKIAGVLVSGAPFFAFDEELPCEDPADEWTAQPPSPLPIEDMASTDVPLDPAIPLVGQGSARQTRQEGPSTEVAASPASAEPPIRRETVAVSTPEPEVDDGPIAGARTVAPDEPGVIPIDWGTTFAQLDTLLDMYEPCWENEEGIPPEIIALPPETQSIAYAVIPEFCVPDVEALVCDGDSIEVGASLAVASAAMENDAPGNAETQQIMKRVLSPSEVRIALREMEEQLSCVRQEIATWDLAASYDLAPRPIDVTFADAGQDVWRSTSIPVVTLAPIRSGYRRTQIARTAGKLPIESNRATLSMTVVPPAKTEGRQVLTPSEELDDPCTDEPGFDGGIERADTPTGRGMSFGELLEVLSIVANDHACWALSDLTQATPTTELVEWSEDDWGADGGVSEAEPPEVDASGAAPSLRVSQARRRPARTIPLRYRFGRRRPSKPIQPVRD